MPICLLSVHVSQLQLMKLWEGRTYSRYCGAICSTTLNHATWRLITYAPATKAHEISNRSIWQWPQQSQVQETTYNVWYPGRWVVRPQGCQGMHGPMVISRHCMPSS